MPYVLLEANWFAIVIILQIITIILIIEYDRRKKMIVTVTLKNIFCRKNLLKNMKIVIDFRV